jgi:hypothetical protein
MRTGAFEFGVGVTLIVAAAMFAAVTVGVLALGDDRVELSIGPLLLYRFVNVPGLTEVHVGPLVFLLALVAGVGRVVVARHR